MGREERELGGIEGRETKIKIHYVRKTLNKILKSFLKKKIQIQHHDIGFWWHAML